MTRYIIGDMNRLECVDYEPRVNSLVAIWARVGIQFRIVRGVVEEFRSRSSGERVVARVLPPEYEADVDAANAEVEAAHAAVKAAYKRRFELLSTIVPHAARVRVPSVVK